MDHPENRTDLGPGDWIIHCGLPKCETCGEEVDHAPPYNTDPVYLVEVTENHLVVYVPPMKRNVVLDRSQWPDWVLATKLQVESSWQTAREIRRKKITPKELTQYAGRVKA